MQHHKKNTLGVIAQVIGIIIRKIKMSHIFLVYCRYLNNSRLVQIQVCGLRLSTRSPITGKKTLGKQCGQNLAKTDY